LKQIAYILFWFLLDSFIEGFHIIYYWLYPLPAVEGYEAQMEQYYAQLDLYLVSGSFRFWIPWLILLTIHKVLHFNPFGIFERLFIVLCLFFAIINTADWFWNMNQRDTGKDWLIFGILTAAIIGVKIYFKKKGYKTKDA
jgi:hypothetical protein